MGPELLEQIREALEQSRIGDVAQLFVEAACVNELNAVLDGQPVDLPAIQGLGGLAGSTPASLSWIEVQGFRGVAKRQRLTLKTGAGLTVVLGRNGSGKSSFVEGLETLLTGTSTRWSERPKEWEEGWLNVHHDCSKPVILRAGFCLEGEGEVTLERRIEQPKAGPIPPGEGRFADNSTLLERGWKGALENTPPLLSYSELGRLASSRPIDLFNALSVLLGLEAVDSAIGRLKAAKSQREAPLKQRERKLPALRALLDQSQDPRAEGAAAAIKRKPWKLDVLQDLALGLSEEEGPVLRDLKSLSNLVIPPEPEVSAAHEALLVAQTQLKEESAEGAARQRELINLLKQALKVVDGKDCPVCGSEAVGGDWMGRTQDRVSALEGETQAQAKAQRTLDEAIAKARGQVRRQPSVLARAAELGLGHQAVQAWSRWEALAKAPAQELLAELLPRRGALAQALEQVRDGAREQLEQRQGAWRPVQQAINSFVEGAQADLDHAGQAKDLEKARKWLNEQKKVLQVKRFAPVSTAAQQTWQELRGSSSVHLQSLEISGVGTKASVTLKATVDDTDAPALGVMSQGELNAMALALFLPRAMAAESPFRFLVIDDPVQAMDPHKVDGLARLLSKLAKDRQVVVFTHDARLEDALYRLQLPASVLEIQRESQSVVRIEERAGAVKQAIKDALRVAYAETELGHALVSELVPIHCRKALEAAAAQRIRRNKLGSGVPFADVEREISDCHGVNKLLALARFGNANKGGEVMPSLNNKSRRLADAYRAIKEGSHGGFSGSTKDLIYDTEKIVEWVGA